MVLLPIPAANSVLRIFLLICLIAIIAEAYPKKGETKAEKAARKAAKAAKKAAKKNNNNAAPAPTTAPAVAQSDNTITLEECDETKLKDFKVQCYVDTSLYDIMDKDFRNPSETNAAILANVKADSLNCISAQAVKAMSNSEKQALEQGKYSFTMEFDLETTGDEACDRKLGLLKGSKKKKGRK